MQVYPHVRKSDLTSTASHADATVLAQHLHKKPNDVDIDKTNCFPCDYSAWSCLLGVVTLAIAKAPRNCVHLLAQLIYKGNHSKSNDAVSLDRSAEPLNRPLPAWPSKWSDSYYGPY